MQASERERLKLSVNMLREELGENKKMLSIGIVINSASFSSRSKE